MFVVFNFFVVMVVMMTFCLVVVIMVVVIFCCLHTFLNFFCFYSVSQSFHKVYYLHVFVAGIFKGVFYPFITFSAHINKNICCRKFCNILN